MEDTDLYHYGVKGMKWGVRRYQNKDGSLTGKGKKRYSKLSVRDVDEQVQRNYGSSKLRDAGTVAGLGINLAGLTLTAITGNPAILLGSTYLSSNIVTATSVGSAVKYYRDNHKYVHKYD